MNTFDKIKKSWWVLFSFIPFLNGFGFIYIGLRHNNKNWLFEGVMYELPWIFYFIIYAILGIDIGIFHPTSKVLMLAFLLMAVGIFRSLWVAIKLFDVYVDEPNPQQVRSTPQNTQSSGKLSEAGGCCLCVFFVFFMFVIIAAL